MKRQPIDYDAYTEEELLRMPKSKATAGLNEQQQRFCECYIEGHNRRIAMIKAGYNKGSANTNYALRLLAKEDVQRYICWLKARVLQSHMINAMDLIDEWVRIAFSDITDFVDIAPHSIRLKPADMIDGQLVKSIKTGRDGISIELHDKMRALEPLARYVDDMPSDWKQRIEERRMQLMEQEFELKKKTSELDNPDKEDDGFIEAIKASAESVWTDE